VLFVLELEFIPLPGTLRGPTLSFVANIIHTTCRVDSKVSMDRNSLESNKFMVRRQVSVTVQSIFPWFTMLRDSTVVCFPSAPSNYDAVFPKRKALGKTQQQPEESVPTPYEHNVRNEPLFLGSYTDTISYCAQQSDLSSHQDRKHSMTFSLGVRISGRTTGKPVWQATLEEIEPKLRIAVSFSHLCPWSFRPRLQTTILTPFLIPFLLLAFLLDGMESCLVS
jgi:hypothetical protein